MANQPGQQSDDDWRICGLLASDDPRVERRNKTVLIAFGIGPDDMTTLVELEHAWLARCGDKYPSATKRAAAHEAGEDPSSPLSNATLFAVTAMRPLRAVESACSPFGQAQRTAMIAAMVDMWEAGIACREFVGNQLQNATREKGAAANKARAAANRERVRQAMDAAAAKGEEFSVDATAIAIGVSRDTVYRYIRELNGM